MSRPQISDEIHPAAGIAAVALFAVLALVFLRASFGEAAGLPGDVSITASIGYALFDLVGQVPEGIETEGFLLAFEIIDLVLVAALVGAVMLARREDDESIRNTLTDGGRDRERDEK